MMRTERISRPHDVLWIGAGIMLLLCAAAPPLHAEIVTPTVPTTTAHFFSSHPMISGIVVRVNDHELVVGTEHGERMTLEVDSRTMAPHDLAPRMTVRTEFAALENGRFHAERVIVVRTGMPRERFQAYADTPESRELMVSNELLASNHAAARHERMRVADGGAHAATMTAAWQAPRRTRAASDRALPGTFDDIESTRPMLTGTVRAANDHQVVVETNQGRTVAMVMDSRTMLPRDLAPGGFVRAEYRQMRDGRYYAQRIHLLDPNAGYRDQYAYGRDGDASNAGTVGDRGAPGTSSTSVASSDGGGDRTGAMDRNGSSEEDRVAANEASRRDGTLPDTASRRPLLLLLGLLGLGSAGALTYLRLRTA